jgi:hypothetical protein
MPPVLSKPTSNIVLKCQKRNVYYPARRSRGLMLSKKENRKFEAALDNECEPYRWSYSSNGRVFPEKKAGKIVGWRLCVRRRTNPRLKKGIEKKSGTYDSQIAAENALYNFRRSLEPKSIQAKFDCWEHSASNQALDVPVPLSGHDPDIIVDESSNPVRRKYASNRRAIKSLLDLQSHVSSG